MKAGFIGLGTLGKTMAQRLIGEGVELVVWNRTIEKAHDLEVQVANSPADLADQVNLVFLNVRDSPAVETILRGYDGLLDGDCEEIIIVDTTTNHFDAVERFHELVRKAGGFYLEAPVVGSVAPATEGNLTVFVSGDQAAFDLALPYLEEIGNDILFLGEEAGTATKMKLVNNALLASSMAAIAEALAFGEAVGLPKKEVLALLGAGAGNSALLTAKKEKLLTEDFSPHFAADLMLKDLAHMEDLARALGKPWLMGGVAKEAFGMTVVQGVSDRDFSVIYKVMKGS